MPTAHRVRFRSWHDRRDSPRKAGPPNPLLAFLAVIPFANLLSLANPPGSGFHPSRSEGWVHTYLANTLHETLRIQVMLDSRNP